MGKIKDWIKTHKIVSVVVVVVALYGVKLSIDFSSAPAFCQMMCHDMKQDVVSYRASFHGSGNNGKAVEIHGHKADCHACHYTPGLVGLAVGKMEAMLSILHEITGEKGVPLSEFPEEERAHILPQYIHKPKKGPVYVAALHGKKRRVTNNACKRCHEDKVRMVKTNALLAVEKDIELESKEGSEKGTEVETRVVVREKFVAVPGPHAFHEDQGVICLDCHQEIAHAPASLGISPLNLPRMVMICFRCHDGEKAFQEACERCHTGQADMHAGVGAKDAEVTEGLMFEEASCADCGHDESNNYKADISTCDGCHDEGYQDSVAEWHETYEDALKPVTGLLNEVGKALSKVSKKKHGSSIAKAKKLYKDAKYNYDYAVKDGSRGAHNIDYVEVMLEKAKEKLEEAKSLLSSKGA